MESTCLIKQDPLLVKPVKPNFKVGEDVDIVIDSELK